MADAQTHTSNGVRRAPYDEHAERALLGAALLTPAAAKICTDLGPEAFSPANRTVAQAVTKLTRQGQTTDPITVAGEIGGEQILAELLSLQVNTPATSNAPTYAARIAACRNRRRQITLGAELADAGYTGADPTVIFNELRELSGGITSQILTPTQLIQKHLVFGDGIDDLPPAEPLIEGILDLDTLAVLYGRSGHGKTFVGIDWALSVATGSWWQRHKVRAGRVLYVVAEGRAGIPQRKRAWQTFHRVHTSGDISWLTYPPNLFEPGWQHALADHAADTKPSLVVIDTLARSMAGGDENSGKDVGVVIAGCDRIRMASGACVLLVHHTGKNEAAGMRGHSALEAAVDTSLECKITDDGAVEIVAAKQKDRPSGEKIRLKMVKAADSVALAPWTGLVGDDEIPEQAFELLATLGQVDLGQGVSSSVWLEASKHPKSSFFRWRKTFVDRGWVVQSAKGFSLTEAGRGVAGTVPPPLEDDGIGDF